MVKGMVIGPTERNSALEGNFARMSWLIEDYVIRGVRSSVMPDPFDSLSLLDHDLCRFEAYIVDNYLCVYRTVE